MNVLLFAFFCMVPSLALGLAIKKPITFCFPLIVLALPYPLYCTGLLFGNLAVGFWLECGVWFVALGLLLWRFLSKASRSTTCSYMLDSLKSVAFVYLILTCLFVLVHDNACGFSAWDEFSHWGMMLKETVRLDALYTSPDSVLLVHKEYPPYLVLFEYAYCRISGGFVETYALQAIHFFMFAIALIPLSTLCEMKSFPKKMVFAVFAFACLLFSFIQGIGFNLTYIDVPLAVMFGVALTSSILLNCNKIPECVLMSLLLATLLLTKQIGIVFFGIVLVVLILKLFGGRRFAEEGGAGCAGGGSPILCNMRSFLLRSVLVVVVPLTISCVWSLYVSPFAVDGQFSLSKLTPTHVFAVFSGEGIDGWRINGFWHLLSVLKSCAVIGAAPFAVSYMRMTLMVLMMLVLWMFLFGRRGSGRTGFECFLAIAGLTVGSLLYAFVLALSYAFGFSQTEVAGLASWPRYASTFVVAALLVLVFFGLRIIEDTKGIRHWIMGLVTLLVGLLLFLPQGAFDQIKPSFNAPANHPLSEESEIVLESASEDASVLIAYSTADTNPYMYAYEVNPRKTSFVDLSASSNVEELEELISQYDYVLIVSPTSKVIDEYASLFSQDMQSGDLYRVDNSENGLSLSRVMATENDSG